MLNRLLPSFLPCPPNIELDTSTTGSSIAKLDQFSAVPMHWFDDTQLPLANWEHIAQEQPPGLDEASLHEWWTSAAGHWLLAMGAALECGYRVQASADFLLLSNLPDRPIQLFLEFCPDGS